MDDPAAADILLRVGEPEFLDSPAYQIDTEDILIITHRQSPVQNLTLEDARALFAGQGDLSVQVWIYASGEDVQEVFDQLGRTFDAVEDPYVVALGEGRVQVVCELLLLGHGRQRRLLSGGQSALRGEGETVAGPVLTHAGTVVADRHPHLTIGLPGGHHHPRALGRVLGRVLEQIPDRPAECLDIGGNLGEGFTAIQNCGIWAVAHLDVELPDFEYGVFPLPIPDGGEDVSVGGGWAFVANANGRDPEAAGEFISWALASMDEESIERGLRWNLETKTNMPARQSLVSELVPREDLKNAVRCFLEQGPGKATYQGR